MYVRPGPRNPYLYMARHPVKAYRGWAMLRKILRNHEVKEKWSNHGPCMSFWEALPTDPPYICSNCGHHKWQHK